MKRYKYTKLLKLGPVDGFIIHTPDDRKLKDTHPQTIVRELNRMADRIKRLEEAHSWRLIETAPSDYTWILGYDEEHSETGMIIFERGDESEPHWTDGMREWEPTHWMPLPEPPKSKEDKL